MYGRQRISITGRFKSIGFRRILERFILMKRTWCFGYRMRTSGELIAIV